MQLVSWLRGRLWRVDDWPGALEEIRRELASAGPSEATAQQLWDLACAIEHIVPDRSRALSAMSDAWRAGHPEALDRAKRLARSLRAHMTLAEMCTAAGDHLGAGRAYLDAGMRELAVDPLQRAAQNNAGGSPSEQLAAEEARALHALASGGKFDATTEIDEALAGALTVKGEPAAALYTHAARIARMAAPERVATILRSAQRACGGDESIADQLADHLLTRPDPAELLDHHRERFLAAHSRRDYVERMRMAAFELLGRDVQPGLALRLLRLALETTYDELLPDFQSHIAAWELLVAHARKLSTTLDLVPLLVKALAAPVSEDEALYLARLGLDIAWREMRDPLAAQPYAAVVLDFVPDHPTATAFVREAGLPVEEIITNAIDAPELPTVTMRPSSGLSVPASTAPPTGAIPVQKANLYADDTQVKRTGKIPALQPAAMVRTGRVALLQPPPPRTGMLRRDVSAIPVAAPPPPDVPVRAPRKIVPIDVVIELPNAAFFSTVLRDVSTSGAFVVTKRKLEIGALLGLELAIPRPGGLTQSHHQAAAKISRATDLGYGIAFVDPSSDLIDALRAATDE